MSLVKIAVLKGGPSAEREVSLRSGFAVAGGLRDSGYDVEEIDVTGRELNIPCDVEAVFIALHGEFGEDGGVQVLLEKRGIPYTGSNPSASRNAFNKVVSKRLFVKNGIQTPDYEIFRKGDPKRLNLPVVVKPACQGSSIGVHRIYSESDWDTGLSDALQYGNEVIVESYIKGRELTVGIVGTEALPVVEIVARSDWYDYDAKYAGGETEYLVPAPVDKDTFRQCQEVALRAFEVLGCSGLARVDFRMSDDGEIYVLEVNTIPGFTGASLLPKAAAEAGISFPELCGRIIETIDLER
ncbi:MAG: D-alanine--D-alanine ligase [Kiritimatiellae bacterium]|nr:D-alanine--D-alanine ligase [Kiritimatiellia bacterium]